MKKNCFIIFHGLTFHGNEKNTNIVSEMEKYENTNIDSSETLDALRERDENVFISDSSNWKVVTVGAML